MEGPAAVRRRDESSKLGSLCVFTHLRPKRNPISWTPGQLNHGPLAYWPILPPPSPGQALAYGNPHFDVGDVAFALRGLFICKGGELPEPA